MVVSRTKGVYGGAHAWRVGIGWPRRATGARKEYARNNVVYSVRRRRKETRRVKGVQSHGDGQENEGTRARRERREDGRECQVRFTSCRLSPSLGCCSCAAQPHPPTVTQHLRQIPCVPVASRLSSLVSRRPRLLVRRSNSPTPLVVCPGCLCYPKSGLLLTLQRPAFALYNCLVL